MLNFEYFHKATNYLKANIPHGDLSAGLILGSGFANVSDSFKIISGIKYSDIPHFQPSNTKDHCTREILLVEVGKTRGFIFVGRKHYYENSNLSEVLLPIYILKIFGAPTVILTNAAGGIGGEFSPGALMRILDHGTNIPDPLIGVNEENLGPRFSDQSEPYNHKLGALLEKSASELEISLLSGNYYASTGPSYETPLRVQILKEQGFHAFGMSTVPEAVAANAWGMKVVGLSCISNFGAGVSTKKIAHENVTEVVQSKSKQIGALLKLFWEKALEE